MWYSGPKQVLYSDTPPTRFNILCKDDSRTLLIMDIPSTMKEKFVNLNSIIDVKRFSSYLKLQRVKLCYAFYEPIDETFDPNRLVETFSEIYLF